MKRPGAGLLFNMSDGLFGVVPRGSGKDFGLHAVGAGYFKFVSEVQDKEVIVERNNDYWADALPVGQTGAVGNDIHPTLSQEARKDGAPGQRIKRIRFTVVPDTITSALELKKGSAAHA